jgi:hypothetical protein
MSWLFSQALVEEYSVVISLDGEQSAPLSGNPTQQAYCAPDKMTAFSRLSRFGMTFKPLTVSHGEDLLTLFLEDSRARTSQQQATAQELMESEAECGEKWHGLLARFDLDTHSWRTVQCSLLEDLNESLQTFPQWGMTVGGELYLLPKLVQTTNENEFGLWLTPSTVDIPTRSAESMEKRLDYRKKIGRNGVGAGCLSEQVEWSGTGPPIGYITKESWPTPTANMYKGSSAAVIRKNGQDRSWQSLHYAVEQVTDIGGRLNPTWVEWLMGWPLGWTDLKPLETDKSPSVPQQHGNY